MQKDVMVMLCMSTLRIDSFANSSELHGSSQFKENIHNFFYFEKKNVNIFKDTKLDGCIYFFSCFKIISFSQTLVFLKTARE